MYRTKFCNHLNRFVMSVVVTLPPNVIRPFLMSRKDFDSYGNGFCVYAVKGVCFRIVKS